MSSFHLTPGSIGNCFSAAHVSDCQRRKRTHDVLAINLLIKGPEGVFLRTVASCDSCDWHFDNLSGSRLQSRTTWGCWNVSQPTTVLLRTTPTRTINQLQTLTHLGHNQQQSFSGLHQPGRSTNYKRWLIWVTTNNSPSQDYTNPDDQPTTNVDLPGSQPTKVLLKTTPTRTINQPQTLTHLGHNQQQSFSGLHQPGRSTNYKRWLTWVTTKNSPSQNYTNPDDQPTTNVDSLGLRPFTVFNTCFILFPALRFRRYSNCLFYSSLHYRLAASPWSGEYGVTNLAWPVSGVT